MLNTARLMSDPRVSVLGPKATGAAVARRSVGSARAATAAAAVAVRVPSMLAVLALMPAALTAAEDVHRAAASGETASTQCSRSTAGWSSGR